MTVVAAGDAGATVVGSAPSAGLACVIAVADEVGSVASSVVAPPLVPDGGVGFGRSWSSLFSVHPAEASTITVAAASRRIGGERRSAPALEHGDPGRARERSRGRQETVTCIAHLTSVPTGRPPLASCPAVLSFVPPMLATSGRPRGALDGWVVEPKADGWRVQVAVSDGSLRAWTRTGRDITANLPELTALASLRVDCVLDGELVAGAGLPADFYGLVGLVSARHRCTPVTFAAFDVLHLRGQSLLDYDQASRRQALECLARLSDGALTTVRSFPGSDLEAVLVGCETLGMEGVVLKRRDLLYRPGRRTNDWRKLKCAGWRTEHAERRLKVRPDFISGSTRRALVGGLGFCEWGR